MLEKTNGLVLKSVKYGETSLIVSIFTEKFGMQSYILKGLRSNKTRYQKAQLFFSGSLLDMVVYQNPQKNLQMMKEYQPLYFYQNLTNHIIKNGIALFAMEVLLQLLIADDPQNELFDFSVAFLEDLDHAEQHQLANYPLFFLIQSGKIAGYHISGNYSESTPILDLGEGRFSSSEPIYPPYIIEEDAALMSQLNTAKDFNEIQHIKMSTETRKRILQLFVDFFQKHIPHFRNLKSAAILSAILN